MKINKILLKKVFNILVYIFAVWGFLLTGVFFAMKLGLTKSSSMIDNQSDYFKKLFLDKENNISERENIAKDKFEYIKNLAEWKVVRYGIFKDKEIIDKISKETGVSQRLIITPLVAEQLRLMTSEREVFKKYFQPLAILGSQTQFSLGIYGIKEKTAKQIETNLKNPESLYYLGKSFENILDYKESSTTLLVYADTLEPVKNQNTSTSSSINATSSLNSSSTISSNSQERKIILLSGSDAERINRLTNSKDHYYSYLYAAIYLKQLMKGWEKSGYDISDRPDIIATLYNIGFENSHPNKDPQVGGAEINLNGKKYTFGAIGFYFYFSDELIDIFSK